MTRPASLALSTLPKPVRQIYDRCACEGCNRTPRAFSRFCTMHARIFFRTRDPNGRAIRSSELKTYRLLAVTYLQRFADHPAVIAALRFTEGTLTDTLLPGAIRKQMQRLSIDGATPLEMLTEFLAVAGLQHFLPHSVNTDASWAFNVGNRVLRVCSPPNVFTANGKQMAGRIPARVSEAYGTHLRQTLGAFASQLWRHIQHEIEAPQLAAVDLSTALREVPFGTR
jgi:hypothetical protein